MLNIDIRTILLLLSLGNILSVLLLIGYYSKDKERHFDFYLFGKVFQSIAWILLSLRDEIPDIYSADFGNTILYIGFALECMGFLFIHEKKAIYKYILLLFVVIGAVSFWLFASTASFRVAISSVVAAFIYSTIVLHILSLKKKNALYYMIGILFGLFCLILSFRAFFAFTEQSDTGLFSGTFINSITFLSLYGIMFVGSLGQVLLLKQNTDQKLQESASIDPLTNVLNRRYFSLNISSLMDLAVRNQNDVSFLMFDLDNFKLINDTYGHASGDSVLVSFSKTVLKIIREQDIFGRIGGEEFCLMTISPKEQAIKIAERIRIATENQVIPAEKSIKFTVSVGVYTKIPDAKDEYEAMIKLADKALYKAKKNGRNQVIMEE